MTHAIPERGQQLSPAGAAAVPPPRSSVPPPPPPPASGATPHDAALCLVDVSRIYEVPLPLLLSAAARDLGAPVMTELSAEPDAVQRNLIAKVDAGARLTYALFHSGSAVVLGLPDSTLRAYKAACDVFEVRPSLPGADL